MNKLFLVLVFLITVFITNLLHSQTDTTFFDTEDILENLVEEISDESENSELFDRFEYYLYNPIDINRATLKELLQIPLLDIHSANVIISHRQKFGNFFSVQELYSIRELNRETVNSIIQFVSVEERLSQTQEQIPITKSVLPDIALLRYTIRSRISNDLQTRRGFTENRYAGSKLKNYNRLLIRQGQTYQAGILTDKDPGESSYTDFVSFHLMANDIGMIKNLIFGDYLLEFGQGLALWSLYPISKSSDAIYPVKKNPRGIRAYTSSTEIGFFRGAASTVQFATFQISAFYSKNKFDASFDEVTAMITSRPLDGYHRTESEIFRKHNSTERVLGVAIQYPVLTDVNLGVLGYNVKLSSPLLASSTFGLSGDEFRYSSFFYDAVFLNMNLFGEFSYDQISVASINGFEMSITRNFSFITALRNYPSNYKNYRGSGFGERAGATNNETGFYSGFKWRTSAGLLNVYYDQFKYPYRTFNNVSPSDGDELFIELTSKPFSRIETKIRYKYENKDVSQTLDGLRQVTKRLRQSVRLELMHSVSKILRLRSRVEINHFNIKANNLKENGYLFFQDFRFLPKEEITIYGRIIFFKTDSFNSAIYEYENDLTGIMTNLPMYGEGMRWYIMVRYKIMKIMNLSFKYAETYKPKERTLSSGNNLIPNNLDNKISLQIDLNF